MNYRITAYLLVPLTGLFLLFHHAAFQPFLSSGDHGRDLYAFAQSMNGAIPYQDYWWVYGPLMPYYYALFFKIFGVAIPSILVGKLLLTILCGFFIFSSLALFVPPLFAFLAALWFWVFQPDFFFTYNHIGGLACLTAMTFALFCYIRKPQTLYLSLALTAVFILSLIKVNFGLANLFALIIFYRLYDKFHGVAQTRGKKVFGQFAAIYVPAAIAVIYCALLFGMPLYEIRQCFPYASADQPHHSTLWQSFIAMGRAIFRNTHTSPVNLVFAVFTVATIFFNIMKFFSNKINNQERLAAVTAVILLTVLYLINMHEYLVSMVLYRSFWATPFATMLLFFTIGYAVSTAVARIQRILFATLFILVLLQYNGSLNYVVTRKIPEQYLLSERGRVTLSNDEQWVHTVEATTEYLKKTLSPDETFFALPYDPIYYYLTDRRSPTRQLIFFEHINIPPQQEMRIISELEKNNVNWVVLSNRSVSGEPGLGILGTTYCPLIGQYLQENFKPIAQIGDWSQQPGWGDNHATRILKRVSH